VTVNIHGQGFTARPALAKHLRRRLGFVVTRQSNRIQRVAIRVGNAKAPRGGHDNCCRMQVHLLYAPVAMIKDVGARLHTVNDRAADRAGWAIGKHLDRIHLSRDLARPGRDRWGSLLSRHAQGDVA
jgi:hypothetical protein